MANTSAKSFKEYLEGSPLFALDSVTGQIIPQTSELKDAWTTIIQNIFGDIDTTEETPIGRLIEALSVRDARACAITASYANQINPNYATGGALDALAGLFSLQRNSATPTIISIDVAGNANIVIPQGSKISNNAGQSFTINNDIRLDNTGNGNGYATSEQTGEIFIETDSVHNIDTEIEGWNSVTNSGVYLAGYDIETDASLRSRILNARWTGTGFTKSILSAIERVTGVQSAIVVDNGFGTEMYLVMRNGKLSLVESEPESTEQYITMQQHTILVVVHHAGSDSDIAKAIFETKSAGCGYTVLNGQSITVDVDDDNSNIQYPVIFNKPQEVKFGVKVTVRKNQYSGSIDDLKNDVRNAIIEWSKGGVDGVDGLQIGQSIYSYEIGSAISDMIKSIQIMNVSIKYNSQSLSSLELFIDKIGVVDTSTEAIEVEVK